jgi:hypothetical protein
LGKAGLASVDPSVLGFVQFAYKTYCVSRFILEHQPAVERFDLDYLPSWMLNDVLG